MERSRKIRVNVASFVIKDRFESMEKMSEEGYPD